MTIDEIKKEVSFVLKLTEEFLRSESSGKASKSYIDKQILKLSYLYEKHHMYAKSFLSNEEFIKYEVQHMKDKMFDRVNKENHYKPEYFSFVYKDYSHIDMLLAIYKKEAFHIGLNDEVVYLYIESIIGKAPLVKLTTIERFTNWIKKLIN